MATLNIGDVVQIVQTWDAPLASVAQNVWHYEMLSGAGAESDDLLAGVLTMMQVAIAEVEEGISEDYAAVLLEARKWDFVNHRFDGIGALAETFVVGTGVGDYLPHQVAALGRIITAASRRQGGTFLPGLTDGKIVDGVLTAAFEVDFADYLVTFVVDQSITGGLFSWCTFNVDKLSPLYETTSIATGTVIANSLPSTLGKRKVGVGL